MRFKLAEVAASITIYQILCVRYNIDSYFKGLIKNIFDGSAGIIPICLCITLRQSQVFVLKANRPHC